MHIAPLSWAFTWDLSGYFKTLQLIFAKTAWTFYNVGTCSRFRPFVWTPSWGTDAICRQNNKLLGLLMKHRYTRNVYFTTACEPVFYFLWLLPPPPPSPSSSSSSFHTPSTPPPLLQYATTRWRSKMSAMLFDRQYINTSMQQTTFAAHRYTRSVYFTTANETVFYFLWLPWAKQPKLELSYLCLSSCNIDW